MNSHGTRAELAGWGANLRAQCFLAEPNFTSDVQTDLDHSGSIARGLGRSYGDCAINAERQVIQTARLNRLLAFDQTTGTLTCEAGASLESIIETFAGRGWFPMITPGTKFVTVAGCIANDIHGKAHHAQGCFKSIGLTPLLLWISPAKRRSRQSAVSELRNDVCAANFRLCDFKVRGRHY